MNLQYGANERLTSTSEKNSMKNELLLRDVLPDDLPIFFEQQLDSEAIYMAAFTSKDPTNQEAFMAHWHRILADETTINQTILFHGQVAGRVSSWICRGRIYGTWTDRDSRNTGEN